MWWRSALLSLASLVVFLGLFEGIVRLASPDLTLPVEEDRFRFDQLETAARPTHVRDDRLGWRLAPDQSGSLTTNDRGFRCAPFDEAKPAVTFRIVVAGDSNPLGFGIADDAAPYPARLDHLLDHFYSGPAGMRFEVLNLAVDGYSSLQVRRLLEEWLPRLDADLVCVQVGFNDYCVSALPDAEMGFGRPWILDVLETSHAYRWLRRGVLKIVGRTGVVSTPVHRVSPDAYRANIEAIVRAARATGTGIVLLTTPACPSVPLVVNEVPVEEDGERTWIAQDRWIKSRLGAAGVVPPDQPTHPAYARTVREAAERHPDWPILPYMLELAARARGNPTEAAVYERRWRELDTERAALGRYADVLGEVAARQHVHLVDVGSVLNAYARGADRPAGSLFIDFVHLDPVGHVVVATELARVVVEDVLGLDVAVADPSGGAP